MSSSPSEPPSQKQKVGNTEERVAASPTPNAPVGEVEKTQHLDESRSPTEATPENATASTGRPGLEGAGDEMGTVGKGSEEIPSSGPILPPPPASAHLPIARLLFYMDDPAGTSEEAAMEDDSDDELVTDIRASPPSCEYNHGEDLEDDPQLTMANLRKFQANL